MSIIADYTAPGWYVGIAAAIFGLVICVLAAVIFYRFYKTGDSYDQSFWRTMYLGSIAGLFVVSGIWLWLSWPLKYDYHHYVSREGVVQKIGNRLISGGEGVVNQRFVFIINGYPYGVDDTRASVAKVGDTVKLFCKKEHEFGQQYDNDGFACRWGGVTK